MNEVQELVKNGRLSKALNILLEQFNEDLESTNDIIALLGRLTSLNSDEAQGVKSSEDLNLERNKIRRSILQYSSRARPGVSSNKIDLPSNFIGLGNEPGWSISIEADSIIFVSDYGTLTHAFKIDNKFEGKNIWHYRSNSPYSLERLFISVTVTEEKWSDDMSGEEYPFRVEVTENFKHFIGVGQIINR